ncbi:BamA/TamA family outer membrane protein [soil metagenome]
MKRTNGLLLVFSLFILVISSCTGLKYIPDGEKLYTGAKIKLESSEKIKRKKTIKKAAEAAVRPQPNKTFLGQRPKLWLYFVAGDTTGKKGFSKWLKKKGEPPVYYSSVDPSKVTEFIDAKLFNIGIFKNKTAYYTKEKKKTASTVYECFIHSPYKISEVTLFDDEGIKNIIETGKNKTLLKKGNDYNLEVLKKERERIDAALKDNGYFYFHPDYLLFKVDTDEITKTIKLKLNVKPETPFKALITYRINQVYINPNYSLKRANEEIIGDTLIADSLIYLRSELNIRPSVIRRAIFFRKEEIYSRKKHNITLNRLMSLGSFKFVNIKFTEHDPSHPGYLDAMVLLTPTKKRTFNTELNLVSKSNNFIGPQLNLNYKNRNTFNGAELLNVTLGSSFETQFSGKYKNLYSYEINPQIELYVPKFITPFPIKNSNSFYIPKTKFALSYSFLKRIQYFNQTSTQLSYGFKWKENVKKDHELNPINLSYTTISKKTSEFDSLLNINPFLKKSYEEQFIVGSTYSFTFNEQLLPDQKNQFYFNVSTEIAGNSLSLLNRIISNDKVNSNEPNQFLGVVYSQFAKISIDTRNYINFRKKNKIALRLYAGLGKAYGNSDILPYSKQFFSGGPNSIRAFVINSLGPGTYHLEPEVGNAFLEQGGDIKLEGNAEYRCNLISVLKGAIFIEAGNTWLLKNNPQILSAPFSISRFYKELAVGTGLGLRLDVSFFVLRFDLGIPLRKPWLDEGKRWVINDIAIGSSSWRSDNLILNIAIGYPF